MARPIVLSENQARAAEERMLPRVRGADERRSLPTEIEALTYAEQVIRMTEGDAAYEAQAPFAAEDLGWVWRVSGTRSPQPSLLTPVSIELRKTDAAVERYGMRLLSMGSAPRR